MGSYIEIPIAHEHEIKRCITLEVPEGTYFIGVSVYPDKYSNMTVYLQAIVVDENAPQGQRHLHIEPRGRQFDTESTYIIGAALLPTQLGLFHFILVELPIDIENTTPTIEPTIDTVELTIDDYRKLFDSENITITRRDVE